MVLSLDVALSPVLQRARHVALHHVGTVAPGEKHSESLSPLPSKQQCLHCQTLPARSGGQELEGALPFGQLLGRDITAMLQERGSSHSHSPVVTSAGGVPRAGLCLAQHGLCGETGCEDSQNPSRNSSCRNSIPEIAPAVPGRGGVLQGVLLQLLQCCQCGGQHKSLQPLLWVLP